MVDSWFVNQTHATDADGAASVPLAEIHEGYFR
jgi:hypothetical protein